MITELKENTWYKLIDKDSFLTHPSGNTNLPNKSVYHRYFHKPDDTIYVPYVRDGRGYNQEWECVIYEDEYDLFEEVADRYGKPLNSETSEIKDGEDQRIEAWCDVFEYYIDNQDVLGVYEKPTGLGTIINCLEKLKVLTTDNNTSTIYTEEMYKNGIMPEKGMTIYSHDKVPSRIISCNFYPQGVGSKVFGVDYTTVDLDGEEMLVDFTEIIFPETEKGKELEEILTLYKNTFSIDTTLEDSLKEVQQYFYDKYKLGEK